MRNITFTKAILCMALFWGYANISGQSEGWKAAKVAESEKKVAKDTPETPARKINIGSQRTPTEGSQTQYPSQKKAQVVAKEFAEKQYEEAIRVATQNKRPDLVEAAKKELEQLRTRGEQGFDHVAAAKKATALLNRTQATSGFFTTSTIEFPKQFATETQMQKGQQASKFTPATPEESTRIRDAAVNVGDAFKRAADMLKEDTALRDAADMFRDAEVEAAKKEAIQQSQQTPRIAPITVTITRKAQPTSKPEEVVAAAKVVDNEINKLVEAARTTETTPEKQSQSFLQKNKKLLIAGGLIGGGVLAIGGILGAILGATLSQNSNSESTRSDITPAIKPMPDIKPDEGIVPPAPYPDPKPNNKDHKKNIETVVNFYTNIEEKFKQTLETSSYFDKTFVIEGEAKVGESTEKICIEYDFGKEGAGELGTSFTPFLVKMLPQGINGVALNPDDIKKLLPEGNTLELFSTLIQPNSAFIFMIKVILLINTTLRDSSKKDAEKVNFIIDEATKLYSRLILNPTQDPTPENLITAMPQTFQQIIAEISLKMYGDLVENVNDPETTVLIKNIGELQKKRDYIGITNFIKKEITPAINKDITRTEKKLLIYSLQNILADAPKVGRDLWNHLDHLTLILTDVKNSMTKAKLDKETISKVDTLLTKIQDVKAGKQKVTVITKKPELEISTKIYNKDVSLNDALKVLFKNFSKIYYAKFNGDEGYSDSGIALGKNATKYALQSIFFRCLNETLQANQILLASKEAMISTPSGKKSPINPDKEFSKICNDSSLKLIEAQSDLKDAILKLVANPNDLELEKAYEKALTNINNTSKELADNQVEFRRKFAVNLPMVQADKSTQTPTELMQQRLKVLRKNSKHVNGIIANEYKPFDNALGFSPAILGVKSK